MRGFNAVRAAVAVLGIMAFASGAWAQTGSEGKDLPAGQWTGLRVMGVAADSSQHLLRVNADGTLTIVDQSVSAAGLYNVTLIQNNALTTSARSDSMTVPISLIGYKEAGLLLTAYCDSATTSARLAVQIRVHGVAAVDTGSTYKWAKYSAAASRDSIGDIANAPGSAAVVGPDEITWVVAKFPTQPRGLYLPLYGPGGEKPKPVYLSVRVRLLSMNNDTAVTASRVKVRVGLVAVPY